MFSDVPFFEMIVRPVSWIMVLSEFMFVQFHGMDIRVGSVGYHWLVG